jgi:beta-galactosidase GanA
MYVNVVVSNPFDAKAGGGASGGADWPVLDVWKAAAPHIAIAAPDLYDRDYETYNGKLDRMSRADNPLFVPETGNDSDFARYFWLTLGKGAIGWSPFGMDTTYANYPLGAKELDAKTLEAFASKFALMAPIARDWARLAFEHPTIGFAKGSDASEQSGIIGRWKVTAQYGLWSFGDPSWTWLKPDPHPNKERPVGGAALIQIGANEFLLAGSDVRLGFSPATPADGGGQFLSVEEGTFRNGLWVMKRRWNGDQTDYGLNLTKPTLLKVRLGGSN